MSTSIHFPFAIQLKKRNLKKKTSPNHNKLYFNRFSPPQYHELLLTLKILYNLTEMF